MLAGQAIHVVEDHPYAYPPLMALLTIPFTLASPLVGLGCWYVVNIIAVGVLMDRSRRLVGIASWSHLQGRELAAFAAALLLCGRFLVGPLETRQFDLVVAAFLFAGLAWLQDGSTLRGAASIGAAAAMKCTPLLFVPMLFLVGKRRAAALVALVAVGLNFLPDVLTPRNSSTYYLAEWKETFLDVAHEVPPGTWFSGLLQNQSVAGGWQRYFRYGLPTSNVALRHAKLAAVDLPQLRLAVYVTYGLLLSVAAAVLVRRPVARLRESQPQRFAEEAALILSLMLLLSPMTSRAHYATVLLPVWLMMRRALVERERSMKAIAVLLLICGPLIAKGIIGKQFGELALAWSLPTWFAGVLFIATAARLRLSCLGSESCVIPQAESVDRNRGRCSVSL